MPPRQDGAATRGGGSGAAPPVPAVGAAATGQSVTRRGTWWVTGSGHGLPPPPQVTVSLGGDSDTHLGCLGKRAWVSTVVVKNSV